MKKELRSLKLTDARSTESANGGFSGYASVKGVLDDYGTIWVDGSYTGLDELVRKGFVPDTHAIETGNTYTLNSNLARFTKATEDARGLYIEVEFLDTQRAQEARSQINDYITNSQQMGLSIGFSKNKSFRVYPKDYAKELPNYLKPQFLKDGLIRANEYSFVEIMQDTPIMETSVTLIPANEEAQILEVRSKIEKRAQYLGSYFEESLTIDSLWSVLQGLMYNVFYDVVCNEDMPVEQGKQVISDAIDETKQYCQTIYETIMNLDASNDATENGRALEMKNEIRSYFCNPDNFSSIIELPKEKRKEAAITALRSITGYEVSKAKLRLSQKTKGIRAGKVVGKAKWNELDSLHSSLTECHDDYSSTMTDCLGELRSFLDENNPDTSDDSRAQANSLRAKLLQRKISQSIL